MRSRAEDENGSGDSKETVTPLVLHCGNTRTSFSDFKKVCARKAGTKATPDPDSAALNKLDI